MSVVVAGTAGLVVWIVLWSIGVKSFDAFLITILITLVASTAKLAGKYLPGQDGGLADREDRPA